MKKHLLALLFVLPFMAAPSLRADVLFYEGYNYFDGPIIQTGTNLDGSTNWFRHSGSAVPSDAKVRNHREEVGSTSATIYSPTRQDDVHRNFTTFTNTQTILYASFSVTCTSIPPASASSTYFAHFFVNSSTFHGRVFAFAGGLPNTWRLGVAGAAGTVNKIFPVDLATNAFYQVVEQWDPTGFNAATL